jgi:phosphoenolpyruvate---glycerone phosphotransferase subunit DhaL
MKEIKLSNDDVIVLLQRTSELLRQHVNELRDLDAALGDGDLGVTIELGTKAMTTYLAAPDESDTGRMLIKLGMNVNKVNPSTFGTLLASAFMGAGKAVQNKAELTKADLLAMGYGTIEAIKKRGKADVGDKTMLDALVPAVEAFKTSLEHDNDIIQALKNATEASEKGMKATETMKAKFGRVSWRPDGGIGVKDGGAAAIYILVSSFNANLIDLCQAGENGK